MKINSERYDALVRYTSTEKHIMPMPAIAAFEALTGGDDILASLVDNRFTDAGSEWRAVWLLPSGIAYVKASSATAAWDVYITSDVQDQQIEAWVQPFRNLSRVEITGTRDRRAYGREFSCDTGTRLRFVDGTVIDLPLFGGLTDLDNSDEVEAFVAGVRTRWADSVAAAL